METFFSEIVSIALGCILLCLMFILSYYLYLKHENKAFFQSRHITKRRSHHHRNTKNGYLHDIEKLLN